MGLGLGAPRLAKGCNSLQGTHWVVEGAGRGVGGGRRGGRADGLTGALGGALGGAPPYALKGERGLGWRLVVGAGGEVMQLLHRRPIRCG